MDKSKVLISGFLIEYIRDKETKQPTGMVVALGKDKIGWSLWNRKKRYLIDEKMVYESGYIKYSILKRKKWEYYQYDYQYQISKGKEIDVYLNSDIELLRLKEKMTISKEKILFIEGIIKTLNTSSFNIRNSIEWQKFQAGSY